MRAILLASLLCLLPLCLLGQEAKVYSARVVAGDTRLPLEQVICEAQTEAGEVVGYTFTNAEGVFRLSVSKAVARLHFRSLGYSPKSVSAQSLQGDKPKTIELAPSVQKLKELVVTAPPIQRQGDTIRYQVSSFKGQGDRSIGDVLSKLPGIKVSETGAISYQGEAISKFYVEGRDLMGGQYGLATRNLNADAVASVEVLERNQHIKALRDIYRPSKAAINIKLKHRFKLRPFGELSLAGGGGDEALYKTSAMLANFSAGIQLIANLKANNTGENVLEELGEKFSLEGLSLAMATPPQLIAPLRGRGLSLPEARYRFGYDYLASAKVLVPLSAERELKVNFSHGKARQRQDYQRLQQIYLGNSILSLDERTHFAGYSTQTDLALNYEENAARTYMVGSLTYRGLRGSTASNIQQNVTRDLGQGNASDLIHHQSQWLLRTAREQVIRLRFHGAYSHSSEDMHYQEREVATPLGFTERFQQDKVMLGASAESSWRLGRGRISLVSEAGYRHHRLRGELPLLGASLSLPVTLLPSPNLRATELSLSLTPDYSYKLFSDRLNLTFALPLNHLRYWATSPSYQSRQEQRTFVSPSLSIDYLPSERWRFFARFKGWDTSYRDVQMLLPSAYLQDYRSFYLPSGNFDLRTQYASTLRVNYQDLLHLIFGNLNLLYRYTQLSFTPEYSYTSRWTLLGSRAEPSHSHVLSLNGEISKGLNRGRTTLSLSPSFTRSGNSFIQQGVRYQSLSYYTALQLELNQRLGQMHQLLLTLRGQMSRSKSRSYKTPWLRGLSGKLVYSLFPAKGWELKAQLEHQLMEHEAGRWVAYAFGDASVRYKAKRWELELIGSNLFNLKTYRLSSYSSLDTQDFSAPLRGRECLLSFKFNF